MNEGSVDGKRRKGVVTFTETERRLVVSRAGGLENGELVLTGGQNFSWEKMGKVLEMDVGDGYTALRMYFTPQNYTLKNG